MPHNHNKILLETVAQRLEEALYFINPFGGKREEMKVHCEKCGTIQVPPKFANEFSQLADAFEEGELTVKVTVTPTEE